MSRPNGRRKWAIEGLAAALLILNVKNTPYPTAVGIALALLIGGSLTCVTVWASQCFGRGGQPEGSCRGKDRRGGNGRES